MANKDIDDKHLVAKTQDDEERGEVPPIEKKPSTNSTFTGAKPQVPQPPPDAAHTTTTTPTTKVAHPADPSVVVPMKPSPSKTKESVNIRKSKSTDGAKCNNDDGHISDLKDRLQESTYGPALDTVGKPTPKELKEMEEMFTKLKYFHGYICREDLPSILKKFGDYLIRITVHMSEVEKEVQKVRKNKSVSKVARKKDQTVRMTVPQTLTSSPRDFVISIFAREKDKTSTTTTTCRQSNIKNMVIRRMDGQYCIETTKLFKTYNELLAHYATNPGVYKGYEFQLISGTPLSKWEFAYEDIELKEKKLGEGAFGEVREGSLKGRDGKVIPVALKMLKKSDYMSKDQVTALMHEARVMRILDHKNVLKSYGVAVLHEPLLLMIELCSCGALREYLVNNATTITPADRLQFCLGSARGVEYIHSQKMIHRDLAVRNVLLTLDKTPKVSDFGLAKACDRYEMKEACKIPVKYLAPETLDTFVFTSKSDVFSFGLVMWEIYADGVEPHQGKKGHDIRDLVKKNQFLKLNDIAPAELKKFVADRVFVSDPENRCSMSTIVQTIEKITK